MAQTIAMSRGTTSVGQNSLTTLYTNSGGTASRVIINMVSLNANGISTPSVNLVYTSTSGGNSVIGYLKYNTSVTSFQFAPANNGVGPAQFGYNASSTAPISGIISANQAAIYTGSVAPSNLNINGGSDVRQSYCPSNIWMGPSDTISVIANDNNSVTFNLAYSFTIITES
jgi:hypothetical protein